MPHTGKIMRRNSLNIIHIDTETGWRGGEAQVFELCKGIHERKHKQTVIVQPDSELAKKIKGIGIDVFELNMRGEWDFRAMRALRQLFRAKPADICHAHTAHAHSLALLATWGREIPRVIVTRRVDFAVGKNVISKKKYKRTNHIIAISNGVKDVLVKCGVDWNKISVVSSGIDLKKFDKDISKGKFREEFSIPEDAFLVSNIASLTDHKGHTFLIDAAELVCEQHSNVFFLIAGEGELQEQLQMQIIDNGLLGKVRLIGFRRDIESLLIDSDLFVMSSHLEGLCTSILDALLMQVPVVATNTGGIPDIIVDNQTGLLVPPKDPASLAESIGRMIDDEPLRKELARHGKDRVIKCFSNDQMVSGTEEIYFRITELKRF